MKRQCGLVNVKWICLILLILAGILAVAGASALESGTCGTGVNYTLDDNGLLTISGSGFMTEHPWADEDVKIVVINSGVKSICEWAFAGCENMTSISIPDGMIRIGESAFYGSKSLTSISIPNSVTMIGKYAFKDCSNLTSATISSNVSVIEYCAFSECCNLKSIIIPNSVTTIGEEAFQNCSSLVSITIPNSVTSIGKYAFDGCSGMTSIAISESIESIEAYTFRGCGLVSVTIPNNVKEIKKNAFEGSSLKSATIPCSVGQSAFSGCVDLANVTFLKGAYAIEGKAFNACHNLSNLIIPDGLYTIYTDAFKDCWTLQGTTASIMISASNDSAIWWFRDNGFEKAVKIQNVPITECDINFVGGETYSYTGKPIEPKIEIYCGGHSMVEGTDYTISFANNTNAGTATINIIGMGYFPGTTSANFTIESVSILNVKLVERIPDQTYNARPITPTVQLSYNDIPLIVGTDYSTTYSDNIKPGTATVTVNGIGNFNGTGYTSFTIVGGTIQLTKSMIGPVKDYIYTGKEIKPDVVVTDEGRKLKKDTDYILSYKNNKDVGKATVTITGIGDYIGSQSVNFVINPKEVKLSSLKAGKGMMTVKWKKGTDIDGYEIEYSQKKDFKGSKKVTISKAKTTSTKIKKLVSGNTYYVRIRGFKKVGGKKYYSVWSKVLNAKVK